MAILVNERITTLREASSAMRQVHSGKAMSCADIFCGEVLGASKRTGHRLFRVGTVGSNKFFEVVQKKQIRSRAELEREMGLALILPCPSG